MEQIKITCKGSSYIDWKELKSFQGNLKNITSHNLNKLKASIIHYGFTAPIFTWNKNILDGHQRLKALTELSKEYEIPAIPIVEIYAETEKEAREKLLRIASQYGEFTIEGIDEYLKTSGINPDSLGSVRFNQAELVYPPDGIFMMNPDGNMGEYKELEDKEFCCPACGHKGSKKDFEV